MANRLAKIAFSLLAMAMFTLPASESGNYPLGFTGLKGGTQPAPGIYVINYDFEYRATELRDQHGDRVHSIGGQKLDGSLDVFANITGVTYETNLKLLGANYGATVFSTVARVRGDIATPLLFSEPERAGYADLFFEPLNLSWHLPRFDLFTAYGVYAPTGKFNENEVVNSGRDRWAHQLSTGMTAYLDEHKKWALAVVPRYEIYEHEQHRDRTGGQDFLFEWGLSRTFAFKGCGSKPWGSLDIGAVGYNEWKTTPDHGKDALLGNVLYQSHAAGAEAAFSLFGSHLIRMNLRYEREFGVIARPQGQMGLLGIKVRF